MAMNLGADRKITFSPYYTNVHDKHCIYCSNKNIKAKALLCNDMLYKIKQIDDPVEEKSSLAIKGDFFLY
jgi:hypothetical protein